MIWLWFWLWFSSLLDWFRPLSDEEQQYLKWLKSDVCNEITEVINCKDIDEKNTDNWDEDRNTTK